MWHVYCFDCKISLRPFAFNNSAILPRADFIAAVKLEITYIGKVHWPYLSLSSTIAPSFNFVLLLQ